MATSRAVSAASSIPAYAKTAGRAVHIKIHPQPLNLAESTEVLRVLQQFGNVVMYKHLKHEPNLHAANTALAIFQNSKSAQRAIDASPFDFQLERKASSSQSSLGDYGSVKTNSPKITRENVDINNEQSRPKVPGDENERLGSLPNGRGMIRERLAGTASFPFPPSPSSNSASPSSSSEDTKQFRLTVTRSILNHHAYIQRQHYYGGFFLERMNIMAEDLEARVPVKGMMDCQIKKEEIPLRARLKRKEEEEGKEKRKTLMELWQEGEMQRGNITLKGLTASVKS